MKTAPNSTYFKRLTLILLAAFVIRCGTSGEGLNPFLLLGLGQGGKPTSENAQLLIQVTDAKTGSPLILSNGFQVSFSGSGSDRIIDESGSSITSISGNQGIVSVRLKSGVNPNNDSPIHLKVTVKADGYIHGGQSVLLSSKQTTIQIPVVNTVFPPTGVTVKKLSSGTTNGSGQLSSPVTLVGEADPGSGIQLQVSIPNGTILTDSQGDSLTGALTATLAQFNHSSVNSLLSFPGGISGRHLK
ncbi:hypothetical protein CH373_01885 [Leptospira perolatii]|uniref:Uncharacterized protein n=1 Tax=Leptospira perolatii TaxID=2023191 RepID=A0A2M9ZS60_9LEPT|nr:hypothetical protein [Leptospira perolatii]PJZ71277.1 hypothetical protein CH360_01885 [Leptospira perolatii]PJZ74811.1 hypothetical protein CH373_01885 [Leptospira perolatii]